MSSLMSGGSLGQSLIHLLGSCSGLTLVQYLARPEDCGAQFLRGVGHSHVRLNDFLVTGSQEPHHSRKLSHNVHDHTRTHTIILHLGPPAYVSSFAFFAFSDGHCLVYSSCPRYPSVFAVLFVFAYPVSSFPPLPLPSPHFFTPLSSRHQTTIDIFQSSQTSKKHKHRS